MEAITEGKAKISILKTKKISKEMPVFYNPVMKFNRDISVLLLNSINKKGLKIALPLAASGIRGIRFLLELKKNKIQEIHFNDYNQDFKKIIKNNFRLNKIKGFKIITKIPPMEDAINLLRKFNVSPRQPPKIQVFNTEANLFLLNSTGFDYIDIDPFGTPNPFLESSVKRLNREGILAVTATDTSALCGTYPRACMRKYWAAPLRNELMHETGLRILIRKAQLIAAQYEKAMVPIFSYSKDHYMRVFLKCEKGKSKVDEVLKQHKMFENAGPMWVGALWDEKLVKKMFGGLSKQMESPPEKRHKLLRNLMSAPSDLQKFLSIVKEESKINTVGFYDIHKTVKRHKLKKIPKKLDLIKKIKKLGYKVSETHFNPEAIRSDIPLKKLLRLF